MLNPTAANLGAKINFIYGPLAAIMTIWAYFRLPEMKVCSRFSHTSIIFSLPPFPTLCLMPDIAASCGYSIPYGVSADAFFQNRSFYDLDVMFEKKVSARNFSKTIVETDADGVATIRKA